MRHAPSTMFFSHRFCTPKTGDGIEWEELPSLSSRVRQLGRAPAAPSGWDGTRPAPLTPMTASPPFHEPLCGVAVREVMDPDVLRHFFAL